MKHKKNVSIDQSLVVTKMFWIYIMVKILESKPDFMIEFSKQSSSKLSQDKNINTQS
jgi:hypothetical protein